MRKTKERWIPKDAIGYENAAGVIYAYTLGERTPCAVGYFANRNNPEFTYSFRSEKDRESFIDQKLQGWLDSFRGWEERKAKAKQAKAEFKNPLKVGDILDYSWGYDQTNPEFYEVVEVKAKSVVVRELAQRSVEGSQYGMSDKRVPVPGKFIGEPLLKVVKPYGSDGACSLSFEFGCATLWDGKPCYNSWYA